MEEKRGGGGVELELSRAHRPVAVKLGALSAASATAHAAPCAGVRSTSDSGYHSRLGSCVYTYKHPRPNQRTSPQLLISQSVCQERTVLDVTR